MRGKAKKKKASGLRISQLSRMIKLLKKGNYSSESEYFNRLRRAVRAFSSAALRVAKAQARHLARITHKSIISLRTLEVNPEDDATQDFQKIQNAIDNAKAGDRILLKAGTFRSGGVIWVNKDLVIEGEEGTEIVGMKKERGKVVAEPATNGAFILTGNPCVEIRNIHFKNLYFAVASNDSHQSDRRDSTASGRVYSHSVTTSQIGSRQAAGDRIQFVNELDRLMFENNICEDVYHSVHLAGVSSLYAKGNMIVITSLNPGSSRSRFNFYDESHVFGFYCSESNAFLEGNHLEVRELVESQPFHAVGAFCSNGSTVLKNNFIKGWHAPIIVHGAPAHIHDNTILGLCNDSEYEPIGISLHSCIGSSVCSNKIISRNLGSGGLGIAAIGGDIGHILENEISLSESLNDILLHKSNNFVVGYNKMSSSIGLFGDQSQDICGNLVFDNSTEHKVGLKMNYASNNTIIGTQSKRKKDKHNTLLGYGGSVEEVGSINLELENFERRQRVYEHLERKVWPRVPEKYLS